MHPAMTPAVSGITDLVNDNVVPTDTVKMFEELLVKFPDLQIYRPDNAKGDCYPCTAGVNKLVDHCVIYEHKLEDVTYVYAWPSTLIGPFRVYSDPPSFIIGKVNTAGFGIVPTEGLEEQLDKSEIGFKAVRQIREHLKSKPAIFYM